MYTLADGVPRDRAHIPPSAGTNERGAHLSTGKNKNSGWSSLTIRCLLTHGLFSSPQTVFGKLTTLTGATKHAHGHHTHAHLAHHHGGKNAALHVGFPPSAVSPASLRPGWWHNNAVGGECQPPFHLSVFFSKNSARQVCNFVKCSPNKTETAYAVSVLRVDKPHCACSFSFSQGELEGAKPASNRIKCRAKPCSARRAWSEAIICVPRSGTQITALVQAVEKSHRLFRQPEQRRLTPSLFSAGTAAGTTPPSPCTTPRRSPARTRCPCRPRRPPVAAAHRPGTPVPAPRRWR